MGCTTLNNDIILKTIDLSKSHASQGKTSKDNFDEIGKYINNNRCRISELESNTATNTVTTIQIKNTIRDSMILISELKPSHIDGVTVTQSNGVTVSRSGDKFIIQTPDAVPILLHNLREKSSKQFASMYKISMDGSNQVVLEFKPFIKQELEFITFG